MSKWRHPYVIKENPWTQTIVSLDGPLFMARSKHTVTAKAFIGNTTDLLNPFQALKKH